jgi:hypothetical protein
MATGQKQVESNIEAAILSRSIHQLPLDQRLFRPDARQGQTLFEKILIIA